MSLKACISNGLDEGVISPDQAKQANELFDDLAIQYKEKMSPEAAEARAAKETFEQLKTDAGHKRRIKLLQIQRYKGLQNTLARYADQSRPGKALQALVDVDIRAPYLDMDRLFKVIRNDAMSRMDAILGRYRKGIVGQTKHKAELYTLVKEIFGEDTGNISAREMAAAWKETAEYLRLRANAAGMRIAKREDWGLPQHHDQIKVRNVSMEEWIDFIQPLLNKQKMIDERTGQPFSPLALKDALAEVYTTISESGLNKLSNPSFGARGTSLANRRTDHRFLVFEKPEGWLSYQQKFGEPDAFATMIGHIESMSRDISMLETLGPNPNAMISALKIDAKKKAEKLGVKAAGYIERDFYKFDVLVDAFTLRSNIPANETMSNWFSGTRNILNASLLGSASITALADFNTQRMAAAMIGIPQRKVITRVLKQMSPLGREERGRAAVRMGMAADTWIQTAYAQARFFDEVTGPEITRRISDTVLRVSGLTPFTQAGRNAFGIEFINFISQSVGKKFDELPAGLKEQMRNNGIGEDIWNTIRTTPLHTDPDTGLQFLRPQDIEMREGLAPGVGRNAATRLMAMKEVLTDFAVPTSSLRARTFLKGGTKPGTLHGEVLASFAQFKSFPVTFLHNHIGRFVFDPNSSGFGRAKNIANLMIGATIMGALTTELSDIAKGRDPRPMDTTAFWGAAMLKGGGLGIYGDFLFDQLNRFGSGLSQTVAGPAVGFFDDLRNLTFGNIGQLIEGKDTNFGSELVRFMSRYTPGTSIWYLRGALERVVFDNLQRWMDPQADRKIRRRIQRYERNYGASTWWESGEMLPSRAPNLENALGE
tara:strand:+ start:2516 stop:4990 length:2475 start_codon:yes stop_codon:yes gene_type:complete